MKSGFVGIAGRPNVGKSTLLNVLLSKKVSIVTPRAQTTRDDVKGILNEKDLQIVFVDTPGIFEGKGRLDAHMIKEAKSAMGDADAVCYLIDASSPDTAADDKILANFKMNAPLIIVFNKIDLTNVVLIDQLASHYKQSFPLAEQVQISALTNFGLANLKKAVVSHLKEGPAYFPVTEITDRDDGFMAREVIRQELLHFLNEEVPHQCAVLIKSMSAKDGAVLIEATILVEKSSHKAIVIGKGGQMIKMISMSARHELERMWHKHVTLECEVKYQPHWREDPAILKELGYGEND